MPKETAPAPPALVTILLPACAADPVAGTPAQSVRLATVADTAVPEGARVIGPASGPASDGNQALIDPDTGQLFWVPASDVANHPNAARAVLGVHIFAPEA